MAVFTQGTDPIYVFPLVTILFKNISEHMRTPVKQTPQLIESHHLNASFAGKAVSHC